MISLTDAAAAHLRELVGGQDDPAKGLRLGVEKGGCAGMEYVMSLDLPKAGDVVVEREGARVLVETASLVFIDGSTIDYCDDLAGTGFRIHNPKAVRSCGCGTSFETAEDASAHAAHA